MYAGSKALTLSRLDSEAEKQKAPAATAKAGFLSPSPGGSRSPCPAVPTARLRSLLVSIPSASFSILLVIEDTYSTTSVSLLNNPSQTLLSIHVNGDGRRKTPPPRVPSWWFAVATVCTKANLLFLSDKRGT